MPITETTRDEHPIRPLLNKRRISHRQLGEAIGYSKVSVEKCVSGRWPVSAEFARRASEYLGLPIEELFANLKPEHQ